MLCFRAALVLLLALLAALPAAAQVRTVAFTARVINVQTVGGSGGLDQFLDRFGLHVEANGEILLPGSFSFTHPQRNQFEGNAPPLPPTLGWYTLVDFQINGVSVYTDPGWPLRSLPDNVIQISSSVSYQVIVRDEDAILNLSLAVWLPTGTLDPDVLPPGADFFGQRVPFPAGFPLPQLGYQDGNGLLLGNVVWDAAGGAPATMMSGKELGNPCGRPGGCAAGNPFDVPSGNKFQQVTDYETVGPNRLDFTRYYNGRGHAGPATVAASLGVNWRGTYDRSIRLTSPAVAAVERADGRIVDFALTGGGWSAETDVDLKLVQTGPSTWTLTDARDTVETYTSVNGVLAILTEVRARNGYVQTLTYDANHVLVAVTDSYGRSLTFTYAGALLDTVTTPEGLVLTYGYSVSGVTPGTLDRLASVTYSTVPATSQTYLYEDAALPFALTGILDENGIRFASWSYDALGRGHSSEHAGGAERTTIAYHADGSRTVTNALGAQTLYRLTTLQGVPKLTQMERLATATTSAATRMFTYDANGYLASATDWNGTRTAYVNDARGLPTSITEAQGTPEARTTTFTFDAALHVPTRIVQPGLTTDLTYDADGNLLTRGETDTTTTTAPYATTGTRRSWTYTWSGGLLASVQGPRTDVISSTQFTYAAGALATVTNALGHVTRVTSHTPGGRPLSVTDPNGVVTDLAYDARQRLISSTLNTATGPLATRFAYDAAGNLTTVTQPDGSSLTRSYDAAHRLTGISDPLGQRLDYTLDALGNRTRMQALDSTGTPALSQGGTFDALGRLILSTAGAGQETRYAYDANGNALSITDPLGRLTGHVFDALNRETRRTDAASGATLTAYDALDRPLSVTAPNGALTTYVYDGFGNLIQSDSADAGRTVYRYDLAGNLIRRNDAGGGQVTRYVYDALDRLRATRYPNAPGEDVTYVYDQPGGSFGTGRLTTVNDAIGRLRRDYDERGLVVREVRTTASATLVTAYAYDAAGRPSQIRYPSGARAVYARDALGRVSGITLRVAGSPARPVVSGITYQPFGPDRGLTYGNGIAETRGFDLDYRLTNLRALGTAAPLQDLAYAYDPADNVLSLLNGVEPAKTQSFGYDALDRLTAATGAFGTLAWTYDANGNRLTQQAGATLTTYTYAPQSNRLTRIQTGAARQIVTYTPFGNIAQFENRPAGAPNTGLLYTEGGRLAQVLSGTGTVQTNVYDGFGQRLAKTGPVSGTALYTYDLAGRLIEDADGQGQARIDYLYLGDRPIATLQVAANQLSFVHSDRLDTPQLATDTAQAVVWKAGYAPFGAAQIEASLIGQTLRFPGQEFDAETGWHHNGFRDYAPGFGRYLQSDPIGLAGGINTYGYVGGNPLRRVDRFGLSYASALGMTGAVLGGALGGGISAVADVGTGGLNLVFTPAEIAAGAVAGARIGRAVGSVADLLCAQTLNSEAARPPTGSRPIDETDWSGDHRGIKKGVGAGAKDKVFIDPGDGVWVQQPDGTWTGPDDNGYADEHTGSGGSSGRRGKDRDER